MTDKKYVINLLKFNSIEVIGSAADKNIKYKADIDLQEFVYHDKPKRDVLQFFQNIFKTAMSNKDLYITDFKAGFYGANVPLRWNYESIMQGFQYIDGRKYTFIQQLKKKSIVKLDIIALIGERFVEITNNYYFTFGKHSTKPVKQNPLKSIMVDAVELQKEGNYLKSLKRIYSFLKFKEINNEDTKQLIDLFNSSINKLSKQVADLKMIQLLYHNKFRQPNKKDIEHNLKLIKSELPDKYKHKIDKLLSSTNFDLDINNIIEQLNAVVNSKLEKYIVKHKLNISPIYYYNKYNFYR